MRSTHIGRGKRPYSNIVMMTIVSFGVACFLFPHLFHRVVASAELFETDLPPQGHNDNTTIELSTSDALAVDGKDCEIDDCELEDPVIGIYLLAETEEYLRFGDAEKTNNIELRDGLIYKLVNISEEWIKTQESLLISGEDPIKIPAGSIVKNATIDLGEKEPEILPRKITFAPTPAPTFSCEDKKWFYVKDPDAMEVGNCSNGDAPQKISYDSAEECCASDLLCMKRVIDVCKPDPYPNTSYPSPAPTCAERKWYIFSNTCSNKYEPEDLLYDSLKDCCWRECPDFCRSIPSTYWFSVCEGYSAEADVCSPSPPYSPPPPYSSPVTASPTTVACEDKKWFYVKSLDTEEVGNCSNEDAPQKIPYDSAEECCASDQLCMELVIDVCKPDPYPNTSYPSPAPSCAERKWYIFSNTCSNQYEAEDLLYDSPVDCCQRECPGNCQFGDGSYAFNICERFSAKADVCSPPSPSSLPSVSLEPTTAVACEDKKWFYVKDPNNVVGADGVGAGNCSNGNAPEKIPYESKEECCASDAFQPFGEYLCRGAAIDVCKPNPYPNTSYPSPAPTCEERKWYFFSYTCSNQYEPDDLLYDSIEDCCQRECPYFCGYYDDDDDEYNLCEKYSAEADVCSSPSPPVYWPTFSPTTFLPTFSPTYIPESYEPTYEQTTSTWPTQAASKTFKEPLQPASYEPTGSAYATPTLLSKVPTAKPTHFAPLKLSMKPSTMSPSNARRNLKKNKRQLQTGTKTVLAVRVVTADGVYNFTEAVLSDKVFGTAGDPVNLKSQYDICSYGQLKFAPTPGRELLSDPEDQTTNIVDGVMTVEIAVNASRLGWIEGITENAITAKINKVFGVTSPKEIADHVMYCLPDHGPFFMAAKGYINSWSSVYNNENCNFVSVQMHEIGHNLRYAHSSEAGMTYADETGMMGYSDELDDWPAKCFNAAKSWQTGWYKSKQAVVIPSATDGDECFEDEMFGIGDFDNPAAQNLLVKISDPNNNNYYITFNTKSSVNAGVRKALDLVTITRSSFENGYQRGESASHLVAKLGSGEQYSTEIDGKEMIVKVSNIGPSSARVIVSQNGEGCQKKPCDCSCSSTSSAKSSKSANSSAKSDKKSSAKSAKKSQDKSSNKSSSKENKKKRKGKSKGKKKKDKKSGSKSARRALQACDCDCDNKSTNVKPDDTDRVPGLKPTAPPQSTAFPTFDFSEPTCTRQKYHSCCRAKSGDLSWLEDKNPPKIYEECMAGIFTATQYCNECLKPCDINGCPKSFSEPTCLKPMYDECCKAKARGRLPWSPANKPPAIYEECMGQTFTPTQYCENCLNPCKINDCPKIYSEPTCTKSMRKECCRANSQGLPWLNDETPPSPLQECMDGIFTVAQYCNSCGYPCKIDDCLPKDEASVDEDNVEGVLTIEGSTDSAFVDHENSELHHTTPPTGNLFD